MYQPPQDILDKYADVMVNFALNGGQGIKAGEVVFLVAPEVAKPLFAAISLAITRAGGHVISDYRPSVDAEINIQRAFYQSANSDQLNFFPGKYLRGLVDQIDHQLMILADTDKQALKGIDPQHIMARSVAMKPYMDWRTDKENEGKLSWTLALYGTAASAEAAGMSLKNYWQQIIHACYLDTDNPVAEWRQIDRQISEIRQTINTLDIDTLHMTGRDVDLTISVGQQRKWEGGGGRNIPSYEIFTSPDWRGTNGWIKFNQPLYYFGNIITGIELTFKDGVVVKATAADGQEILQEMVAAPGANKIGEFSLTDSRFSRITKPMAETLFDENMGGKFGNTHLALGRSYHDCFSGNLSGLDDAKAAALGFNDSAIHTDIISTTDRTVTATLKDGTKKVMYKKGQFQV